MSLDKSGSESDLDADTRQIMSTDVLRSKKSQKEGTIRQIPGESQSSHLFMGAPLMRAEVAKSGSDLSLNPPPSIEGVPRGMEYLLDLDKILINNQSIHVKDEVVGVFQAANWHLMNTNGQRVYIAAEKKYNRKTCCPNGESRPFNISVLDPTGATAFKFSRHITCGLCFWGGDSCGSVVSVLDSDDQLLGYISQKPNPCTTTYSVFDSKNREILTIKSTKCRCWYSREKNEFEIYKKIKTAALKEQKVMVGGIQKNWSGAGFADFVTADTFGVEFKSDLEIETKGILIAAAFLIEFQFFGCRKGKCTGFHFVIYFIVAFFIFFMLGCTVEFWLQKK